MMEPMITDAMVEEFRQMDTCCLSDAMDRLGIPCGLEGIKPSIPTRRSAAGRLPCIMFPVGP